MPALASSDNCFDPGISVILLPNAPLMITWSVIDAVATVVAVGLTPVAAMIWRRMRRRALERNEDGRCASCGLTWTEIGVAPVEYRVHGAEICAPCAHRLRRRTIAEFAGLATATALASAAAYLGFVKYYQWTPWWGLVWLVSPPIVLATATSLTIRRMKERNRIDTQGGLASGSATSSIAAPLEDDGRSARRSRRESWRGHDRLARAT